MPYELYKVLHIIGAFTIVMSLGALALHVAGGGTREFANRKWIAIVHGIGLLLSLVAGFGLLARLGLTTSFPGWAIAKLVIWLMLGGMPALIYRKGKAGKALFFAVLALAGLAAFFAVYKPGS